MVSQIAVVIPLHNKGRHITRALHSVAAQTIRPTEVIVVDDASHDNGPALVQASALEVQLFRRDMPGPGGYAARNVGVQQAKSDWIAFLDADDEWLPDHLERFLFANSNCDNFDLYSSGYEKAANGRVWRSGRSVDHLDGSIVTLSFPDYLISLNSNTQAAWTSANIVRKTALVAAGGFPEGRATSGGDTDTWLRIVHRSGGMVWNGTITARYHIDSDSMVTKKASSFTKGDLIIETAEKMITSAPPSTKALLRALQARKFYNLTMARKRFPSTRFEPVKFRLSYLRSDFRIIFCFIPAPLYRIGVKIRSMFTQSPQSTQIIQN